MFILPFTIPESPKKIGLRDPVFSIGSCFADEMGIKLTQNKFNIVSNPLGTIYNPLSIFRNLRLLLSDGLDPANYVKSGDIYYHWDTHSIISATNPEALQLQLKELSDAVRNFLAQTRWLIITLGTSRVYKHLKTDQIVANCHKVPGKEFDDFLLTSMEIVEEYFKTREALEIVNPEIEVILSVSPVRHIRDGLISNTLSKAILLQAVDEITKTDKHASYFPAYELMIDVLRDYRFYQPDMIHPTPQAVDYIWERFTETFINSETRAFIDQWTRLRKAIAHRPFHPSTTSHQNFLKTTIKQLRELEGKVDVTSEIADLEKQLI